MNLKTVQSVRGRSGVAPAGGGDGGGSFHWLGRDQGKFSGRRFHSVRKRNSARRHDHRNTAVRFVSATYRWIADRTRERSPKAVSSATIFSLKRAPVIWKNWWDIAWRRAA